MTNKQKYQAFIAELEALERELNPKFDYRVSLSNECVDHENVDLTQVEDGSDEYYSAMLANAKSAAGMRAEDLGINLNKLLGRNIY